MTGAVPHVQRRAKAPSSTTCRRSQSPCYLALCATDLPCGMPSHDVTTFDEAIADSASRTGPKTLLMGNGFSIDWNHEIFRYNSLHEDATFDGLSVGKDELFERLGTFDFEVVIERLNSAADLADLYETADGDLPETLREDAQIVRNGLADVLAFRHPNRAQELTDDEVLRARIFLSHFLNIFTVNYDLLLYWVVNRSELGHTVPTRDGFEWPSATGPHELIWKSKPTQGQQRIYYLHGALHYFREADKKIHKLRYNGAFDPLIDQVRERIKGGQYPRIVTEGRTEEKQASIAKSAYLRHCHRVLGELSGILFVHGLSLSPNDDHILALLEAEGSEVSAVYVGLHGNPDSEVNDEIMRRARRLARRRQANGGANLDVLFYDSASAHVWR